MRKLYFVIHMEQMNCLWRTEETSDFQGPKCLPKDIFSRAGFVMSSSGTALDSGAPKWPQIPAQQVDPEIEGSPFLTPRCLCGVNSGDRVVVDKRARRGVWRRCSLVTITTTSKCAAMQWTSLFHGTSSNSDLSSLPAVYHAFKNVAGILCELHFLFLANGEDRVREQTTGNRWFRRGALVFTFGDSMESPRIQKTWEKTSSFQGTNRLTSVCEGYYDRTEEKERRA